MNLGVLVKAWPPIDARYKDGSREKEALLRHRFLQGLYKMSSCMFPRWLDISLWLGSEDKPGGRYGNRSTLGMDVVTREVCVK